MMGRRWDPKIPPLTLNLFFKKMIPRNKRKLSENGNELEIASINSELKINLKHDMEEARARELTFNRFIF